MSGWQRDHLDEDALDKRSRLGALWTSLATLWWIAGAVLVARVTHVVPAGSALLALSIVLALVALVLLVRDFRYGGTSWDPLPFLFPPLIVAGASGQGWVNTLDHPGAYFLLALVAWALGKARGDEEEREVPDPPVRSRTL